MKTTFISGFVGTALAIDAQAACQSACGLVASADACKRSVAERGVCKMLLTDGETLRYGEKLTGRFSPLTINEATALVSAPSDNCFAMCYDNAQCKPNGSYCTTGDVCPNLYWDKSSNITATLAYGFYTESNTTVNTDSAVMCNFKGSEQPILAEDLRGYVDPCPAVCALTHTPAECALVQRFKGVCHRLFWTHESKRATRFKVQTPSSEDIPVDVETAFELLKESSCEEACDVNPHCTASFCNTDNRTCKELFYNRGAPVKDKLTICFGERCKTDFTPVMCELAGDRKGAIKGKTLNKTLMMANADDESTDTTKSGSVINVVVVIGMIAFISSL